MADSDDSPDGSSAPGAFPGGGATPHPPPPRPGWYPAPPPPPPGRLLAGRPGQLGQGEQPGRQGQPGQRGHTAQAGRRATGSLGRRGSAAGARHGHGSRGPGTSARAAVSSQARWRRLALATSATLSAVVLAASGGAWALSSYVNATVGRVDAGVSGQHGGALNVLVAGVDQRAGLTPRQQAELHVGHVPSTNTDTMMLVHISADRNRVTVVSLPRDSWVDLPGHGMNKINAAFGLGGPKLMVATVERATGLRISDFAEVNFLGFIKVIDALGGVNVCLPYAVNDSYTGLHLSAGMHHVDGITALKYARDRHSFALSDLARIRNQQSLLASLLSEAISSGTLANPVRLSRFLQAALAAIKVNRGLDVTALAGQLRGISPRDVRFLTVPVANAAYRAPDGELAVQWDQAAARRLFTSLQADRAPARARPGGRAGARPGHGRGHAGVSATSGGGSPGAGTGGRTAAAAACH
jgi:LCP family protein required for cell wall assembly